MSQLKSMIDKKSIEIHPKVAIGEISRNKTPRPVTGDGTLSHKPKTPSSRSGASMKTIESTKLNLDLKALMQKK